MDPHTQQVIASAPRVPGPLPKEEELVEVCRKEVQQEGRRVLVYVTFTETRDLTPRIAELLTAAGLRVAVLKGSVEAARRRGVDPGASRRRPRCPGLQSRARQDRA